jgi:hypothetical protein
MSWACNNDRHAGCGFRSERGRGETDAKDIFRFSFVVKKNNESNLLYNASTQDQS